MVYVWFIKFHGISFDTALHDGFDIRTVLNEYKSDIENYCSKLVCHNIELDKNVVLSEFVRHDMDIKDVDEYCTMKKTQYKLPSLAELYRICCNEELQNPHNAYYDMLNCAKCYFQISSKWISFFCLMEN